MEQNVAVVNSFCKPCYHSDSTPLISQIVGEQKYTLTKRSFFFANQRQRTRHGIFVREGGDNAVRRWGGRPTDWVRVSLSFPPSGSKQKMQLLVSEDDDDNTTIRNDNGHNNAGGGDRASHTPEPNPPGQRQLHTEADNRNAPAGSYEGDDDGAIPPTPWDQEARR